MMAFLPYWPWIVAGLFLIGYELFAVSTQVVPWTARRRTLSEMVWAASRRYPWLKWAVLVLMVVLFDHFFTRWVL